MSHHDDATPPGTARIPGESDFIKIRVGTLAAVIIAIVGAAGWATKTTFDIAQMKADIAELKAYLLTSRPVFEPHLGKTP